VLGVVELAGSAYIADKRVHHLITSVIEMNRKATITT